MNKYLFILVLVLMLSSGCISRKQIYIKNSSDDVLYFDDGCMGIKSPLLEKDAAAILAIAISGRVLKDATCKKKDYGLLLALHSDTIHISESRYRSILDSLIHKCKISKEPCQLTITKDWLNTYK